MTVDMGPLIAQGRTSDIYRWKDSQVLKLYQSWLPAAVAESEVKTTQAVYREGIHVPVTEGTVEVEGRAGIIFEYIEGSSMISHFTTKPWGFHRFARIMAEVHAELHVHEIPELPSQRQWLESCITNTDALTEKTKKAVLAILETLPDGNTVCHGDLHPGNIIMSPQGPIITDWMNGCQGNPLADVVRTKLLCLYSETGIGFPMALLVYTFRKLFYSAYIHTYLRLRPSSQREISAWFLPVAAARLYENIPGEQPRLLKLINRLLKSTN